MHCLTLINHEHLVGKKTLCVTFLYGVNECNTDDYTGKWKYLRKLRVVLLIHMVLSF